MRVSEVAKQENVSMQTVRRWINQNLLKATFDAQGYIIDLSDLEEFKQKQYQIKMQIDNIIKPSYSRKFAKVAL